MLRRRKKKLKEEDAFGGFDEEEDQKYIEKAEKKWLKKRGLDPHAASKKVKSKDSGKAMRRVRNEI